VFVPGKPFRQQAAEWRTSVGLLTLPKNIRLARRDSSGAKQGILTEG